MLITLVNVASGLRDDLKKLGCDIVRDAPDTGLDVQMYTTQFSVRICDGYIKLRNKGVRRSLLLYDYEFRSIYVR